MNHHVIRSVQRDCICPKRPPEAHTQHCDRSFRAKFFGTWEAERDHFYRRVRADN